MAYEYKNSKGIKYYLHSKDVKLKDGKKQKIYFFAREIREGALDALPKGYKVVETEKTGMPILKKAALPSKGKKRVTTAKRIKKKTEDEDLVVKLSDIRFVLVHIYEILKRIESIIENFKLKKEQKEVSKKDYMEFRKSIEYIVNQLIPNEWKKLYVEIANAFSRNIKRVIVANIEEPATIERRDLSMYLYQITDFKKQIEMFLDIFINHSISATLSYKELAIELTFQDMASFKSIKDMEDKAKVWRQIFSSFSRVAEVPTEDPKILYFEQGSLIIYLGIALAVYNLLGTATLKLMEILKKRYEIVKIKQEIESLKLHNKEATINLEKAEKELINSSIPEISTELLKKHKYNKSDKGEVKSLLNKALKDVFEFIDKGGNINFLGKQASKNSDIQKLPEVSKQVFSLKGSSEELEALPEAKATDKDKE